MIVSLLKKIHPLILASAIIAALYFVEEVWTAHYVWKSLVKIMFMLLPALFLSRQISFKPTLRTKMAVILGVIVVITVICAYFIVNSQLDLSHIKDQLQESQQLTWLTFSLAAIYICLGNSLVEELFFRHYLKEHRILSSALFALYHMTLFWGWFSVPILILALIGLFVGGYLFATLNDGKTVLNGWIMHFCADLALVIVGAIVLGFV